MQHSIHRLRHSKLLRLSLKLGLTVAALWLALRGIDARALGEMLRLQHPGGIAAVMVLTAIQVSLGALRWRLILKALADNGRHVLARLEVLKLYYISLFFIHCLPGTVGSDVIRAWMAKSDQVPLTLAIHSVIIDRMIALAALAVLGLLTLPVLGEAAGIDASAVAFAVLAAAAGFVSLFYIGRPLASYQHIRPVRWLLYFIDSLRLLLKRPGMSALSLLYALLAHLGFCLAAYLLAQSLGIGLDLLHSITLIPWMMLATVLPISIGGWGVREISLVGLLALIGVPQEQALMLAVQLGVLGIIFSLPGGLLWLAHRKKSGPHAL